MDLPVLVKYFLHGIAFSLLSIILVFVLVFILVLLIAVGSFIGLIIGLAVAMLAYGGLNSMLANAIWGANTKTSLLDLLFHGFVLFLVLLVVNGVLVMIPNYIFPGIATTLITFVIGAFAGGYVGKMVAGWFESEFRREEIPSEAEAKWTDTKL